MLTIAPRPALTNRGATAPASRTGAIALRLTILAMSSGRWSHKAARGGRARVVDQNADPMIVAEPSLHLREVPYIGEVGSQDIDVNTGFPTETVRQRLHPVSVGCH